MKQFLVLIVTVLVLSACSQGEATNNDKLKIYTTVYPLEYLVNEIGGETVETESIIPPGADGHSYEPTIKEMTHYADGDGLIYVGEGMEAFSSNIASALENQDVELVEIGQYNNLFEGHHEEYQGFEDEADQEVIEGQSDHYHTGDVVELTVTDNEVDEIQWSVTEEGGFEAVMKGDSFDHEAGEESFSVKAEGLKNGEVIYTDYADIIIDNHDNFDPHIWIDPLKMIEVGDILKDELIALNPEHEALYEENFNNLQSELEELDEKFSETLDDKESAKIIVPHAAFGYWSRYGVEQLAVSGYSMSDEPSQQQLKELSETAQENNLNYVLFEQNSSGKISKVVQDEIGAEPEYIHNMEVLTEENISNDEDYISLMEKNLQVLDKVTE
ncbi:metal ABC transporter solute-binding protein, Zn/Mn family [Jeotgalicoccus sp. ATCC 8456]|uniref:metal ABC transporter solute-binding protein, Zn/Mn family n=1 Tax=Jeotgalicoccus sp. ATCC 8456 TaxID=946435 RepID=UPI0018E5E13B|nr:zinc ABC transporter substrate-binding protein [Jeotgalicoccus sp. ATCC 8456]QQD84236.1 zinc ABC transporter substrate-binding protein [Jeotgalicoccus sp. ATCC 8456]